jgi:hypothetical protein
LNRSKIADKLHSAKRKSAKQNLGEGMFFLFHHLKQQQPAHSDYQQTPFA